MADTTVDPLFDAAVVEDPWAYYDHLRETDPVHHVEGTDAYLVTRLDLIQEVVGNPSVYSSSSSEFLGLSGSNQPELRTPSDNVPESMPGVLATADPPDHGRQRKVLNRVLSTTAINAREPDFRELIDAALDACLPCGRVEWMSEIAEPLPMIMVARLLGLPDSVAPQLKEQGYASVEQISGFVAEEQRPVLQAKMMEVGPVIEGYLAARASQHPDQSTVLGVCAKAVEDGELTELEAFGIFTILLAAGGESTTSLLGTGVRILAEQPKLQQRLREELPLVRTFVEEACRVEPPFRGHYRRVLSPTRLAGTHLEAGARLVLVWPAANRDPRVYTQPTRIDLDRSNPRQHMGFGWGIHLCIGAPLARLEAKVTFERLLTRTTSISAMSSAESLRHHQSLMIRRLTALPLTLTPS